MKDVTLGNGLRSSAQGFGCMGLTTAYGTLLKEDAIVAILKRAHDLGVTMWDTANLYSYPSMWRLLTLRSPIVCQEEHLAPAIAAVGRENVTIATKTGLQISLFPRLSITVNNQPSFLRAQCDSSLRRLRVDSLDLFYLHRIDPAVPIELSMLEMKRLVHEGKVRHIGLSEMSSATLRRAHSIHPVTAVQVEYSLWCRGIEADLLPTCKELGVGVVAYSPLGRGFLAAPDRQYEKSDFRASQPRMTGDAGEHNRKMLAAVEAIAERKNVSLPQLALAWVQAQAWRVGGAGMVPIPGTTKIPHLETNAQAADIELTEEDIEALEAAVPWEEVQGERYNDRHMQWEGEQNRAMTTDEAKIVEDGLRALQ